MDRKLFEDLVERAVNQLPPELAEKLENVDVVVQDTPSAFQLSKTRLGPNELLLGLYEGIPLTRRGQFYGLAAPDKITIFQKAIEIKCNHNDEKIVREISRVVKHEIAHHFGIGDARLKEIEGED